MHKYPIILRLDLSNILYILFIKSQLVEINQDGRVIKKEY